MKEGGSADEDVVVVAGIGARLPGRETWFQEETERGSARWPPGFCGIKNDVATLTNIDKFDSGAFRVHSRMAATLDPQCRLMLEVVWEALVDAGYNPENLRGSKTAVWVACNRSETGEALCGKDEQDGYLVLGNCRAMYSNRVSYAFDFKGHSVTVDGGGASSGSILYTATQYLEEGKCDYAVVGATNLIFKPGVQIGLELTAAGGKLTRGEAVIAVVLTRKSLAVRPYCEVKGVSCTWLGLQSQGDLIKSAIMKTYLAAHIDPDTVDKVDLAAIPGFDVAERYVTAKIFSSDKIGEERSIDYESAAGLFALLQASQLLHTDKCKLVGINDLSRTGNFSHIILSAVADKRVSRVNNFEDEEMKRDWVEHDVKNRLSMKRVSHPKLSIKFKDKQRSLSPLMRKSRTEPTVCCNPDKTAPTPALAPSDTPLFGEGRTEAAVRGILDYCAERVGSGEERLLQNCMVSTNSVHLPYRGYKVRHTIEIRQSPSTPPPIWLICSGVGSQWVGMLKKYSIHPLCAEILEDLTQLLLMHSFDLTRLVYSEDIRLFDDPKSLFVGLAVVQCLQIELLRAYKVPIAGVLGHSFGEHAAAFASGCLNRHEFILTAHARGKVVSLCEAGAMAVVACSWKDAKDIAVKYEVEVACDNAPKLVTMSGLQSNIYSMLDNLHKQGLFARLIKSGNRAFHSSLVRPATGKLTAKLHRIITEIREPSIPWLSSSGQTPFSREYLSNNLQLPVRFTGAAAKIPPNALILEIGAHPVIKPMLRDHPNTLIFLSAKDKPDASFGRALGELYLYGHKIHTLEKGEELSKSGPVGHVVKWEHSQSWYTPKYDEFMTVPTQKPENTLHSKTFTFNLDGKDKYLYGHKIDNTSIFPGAGYLSVVLDMIAETLHKTASIELSDITFARALSLSSDKISLKVHLDVALRVFMVEEQDITYCRGKFKVYENIGKSKSHLDNEDKAEKNWVSSEAFYKEMKLRGYCYEGGFQMITKYRQENGSDEAHVHWDQGNKILLIDSVLQSSVFNNPGRKLVLPSRITKLVFDLEKYKQIKREPDLRILGNPAFDCWNAECLYVYKVEGTTVERKSKEDVIIMTEKFSPFAETDYKENTEVIKYRNQLLNFNKVEITKVLEPLSCETTILDCLERTEGTVVTLSDVLSDVCFNTLMDMGIMKSALDMAFGDLEQRVTVFIVGSDCNLNLKDHEKFFPSKTLVISSFESFKTLVEHCKKTSIPSSTLIVFNHAFTEATFEDATRILNEIIRSDTFLVINQVNKLTGLEHIIFQPTLSVSVERVLVNLPNMDVMWKREGNNSQVVMIRRKQDVATVKLIEVDDDGSFLDELMEQISAPEEQELLLTGNGGEPGLARCLRLEHIQVKHKSSFGDTEKHGTHTYVPVVVEKVDPVVVGTSDNEGITGFFCEVMSPGDMTSLTWIKSNFSKDSVQVTFSALNFRDPMVASRRLNITTLPYDGQISNLRRLGIEYSGTTTSGENVMGIVPCQGLSTHIEGFPHLRWKVPERFTLAEAATLPLAYCTAYYGLVARAGLQSGQSVLVHCGAGAVGTAAIRIAFTRGCEVWTTVSSADKRNYLLSTFPDLKRDNIGHSRSQSFVRTVMNGTRGQGVDIVLNSLSGKLLVASARCVKTGGHFVEIGKYDMQTNSSIPKILMIKGCQIHGVQLDELWLERSRSRWGAVHRLFAEGLESGEVVPLQYTTFTDVGKALKFITSGKHKGKVIIEMTAKNNQRESVGNERIAGYSPNSKADDVIPYGSPALGTNSFQITEFRPDCSGKYFVTGGLGSLGIELATWLVETGCSVILSGRSQPSPVTQLALNALRGARKDAVTLQFGDVTDKNFVDGIFQSHKIVGVFHLAGELHDSVFSSSTQESWKKVVRVKVKGAENLDSACRNFPNQVSTFVSFSSIVAAFGNAGQSSYGYANSALDNICRKRVEDGLPGVSIQWGLINAGMGVSVKQVCGSAPMSIQSFGKCLQKVLQCKLQGVVLAYVPFKQASEQPGEGTALLSRVSRVLGVKDLLSHGDTLLSRFGLDSLMAVELAALLARDAGVNFAPDKIRDLTFSALHKICSG